MRSRKLLPIAGAILALSLGVAACGDDDDEGDGGGTETEVQGGTEALDLTVGVLVPQTGDLSPFAPPGEKAAEIAGEVANEAFAEVGSDSSVELPVADTETKASAAQTAAEDLIADGATCLVGPWASDETIPVGRAVAARQQVPLISPSSTSPAITELPDDGYVFRTAPSDALQGQVLADAVGEQFGTDATISLAARNDAYGEGIITAFQEAFESAGGTTTGPVLYDLDASSYDSEADQIVADDPDGYVIVDFEDPYTKVGPALVRTGNFDPTKMFTTDGLAFEPIPDSIPLEALDGASGTRPATPEDTDTAKAFGELYDSAGGEKERGTFDAQNFDAVSLCVLAAVAAGSTEGPDIQAQIQNVSGAPGDKYDFTQMADAITALQNGEDIDFEGVTGPLDLDDNGDPGAATYETFTYENGELEVTGQVEVGGEE